jgi:hypothetical protein
MDHHYLPYSFICLYSSVPLIVFYRYHCYGDGVGNMPHPPPRIFIVPGIGCMCVGGGVEQGVCIRGVAWGEEREVEKGRVEG